MNECLLAATSRMYPALGNAAGTNHIRMNKYSENCTSARTRTPGLFSAVLCVAPSYRYNCHMQNPYVIPSPLPFVDVPLWQSEIFRDTYFSFGYIDERGAVQLQTVEGGCPPMMARNPLFADPTAFVTIQVDAGSLHVNGTYALLEPLGMVLWFTAFGRGQTDGEWDTMRQGA